MQSWAHYLQHSATETWDKWDMEVQRTNGHAGEGASFETWQKIPAQ